MVSAGAGCTSSGSSSQRETSWLYGDFTTRPSVYGPATSPPRSGTEICIRKVPTSRGRSFTTSGSQVNRSVLGRPTTVAEKCSTTWLAFWIVSSTSADSPGRNEIRSGATVTFNAVAMLLSSFDSRSDPGHPVLGGVGAGIDVQPDPGRADVRGEVDVDRPQHAVRRGVGHARQWNGAAVRPDHCDCERPGTLGDRVLHRHEADLRPEVVAG